MPFHADDLFLNASMSTTSTKAGIQTAGLAIWKLNFC
jgi:hypothetical protein